MVGNCALILLPVVSPITSRQGVMRRSSFSILSHQDNPACMPFPAPSRQENLVHYSYCIFRVDCCIFMPFRQGDVPVREFPTVSSRTDSCSFLSLAVKATTRCCIFLPRSAVDRAQASNKYQQQYQRRQRNPQTKSPGQSTPPRPTAQSAKPPKKNDLFWRDGTRSTMVVAVVGVVVLAVCHGAAGPHCLCRLHHSWYSYRQSH